MGQLRFGTDGVRGRALTELTTDYVASLGRAAAEVMSSADWLLGRDTRESSPVLEQALMDGLAAWGALPLQAGQQVHVDVSWKGLDHGVRCTERVVDQPGPPLIRCPAGRVA